MIIWVYLAIVGGTVGVCSAVYCAVSKPAGIKIHHPADAARLAKQLIDILYIQPDLYINIPDRYQFINGLHWVAYPEDNGVKLPVFNPKIDRVARPRVDPACLKVAHPDAADAARVTNKLITILMIHPDLYKNMPDRYQFVDGLFWLAYPADAADARRVAKKLINILSIHPDTYINMPDRCQFNDGLFWLAYRLPVKTVGRPRIDPAGLNVAPPDAADAARVANQLIRVLSYIPDSYINMPHHNQFTKGLYWLAYPEGLGIKLPVVSPKIDPVESPKIELDEIVVVNPRIEPVEVVEVDEDGNLRIQYV